MWLLDVNIPVAVVALLRELGIEACTARSRGWDMLNNGDLTEAAARAGFSAILTRDRLFGESASQTLGRSAALCLVVVTLPQLREPRFTEEFRKAWHANPITPARGQVIYWPSRN